MSLKETIQTDLLKAMKAKEELKLNALRMVKAAIMKWEVDGEKKEAKDDDVIAILKREIKQRKDSAEQFAAGNRPQMAEKEEAEAKILATYLPAQMAEEQVKKIAEKIIAETGASGAPDFGKVMGMMMKEVKGQADGGVVQKVVKEILA